MFLDVSRACGISFEFPQSISSEICFSKLLETTGIDSPCFQVVDCDRRLRNHPHLFGTVNQCALGVGGLLVLPLMIGDPLDHQDVEH